MGLLCLLPQKEIGYIIPETQVNIDTYHHTKVYTSGRRGPERPFNLKQSTYHYHTFSSSVNVFEKVPSFRVTSKFQGH